MHRQPRAGYKILGAPVGHVPVILQLKFLQSMSYENVKVPQIQFIVRVLDIPVATESGTCSAKLCRRPARFHRCSSWVVVDAPVVVQRLVSDGPDSAFRHFSVAFVSFSLFWRMGVACGVQRFGFFGRSCVLATWLDSGYMFFDRLWTNFSHFLRCGELES